MTLKIAGIKIQNLKNIELVDLQLADNFQLVAGNNGAGKSTLVEGIFMGIVGKKLMGKAPQELIKEGEKTAIINVQLKERDGEKEINIERKITEKDVYLRATDNKGQPLLQKDLDAMLSDFTIDPLAFTRLKNKEQVEFVKKIAGINTTALDEKRQALFDERTYINRNVGEKKTLLANMGNIENIEKKDTMALVQERAKLVEHNNHIENLDKRIIAGESQIEEDEQQIKKLQQMIKDLEELMTKKQALVLELKLEREGLELKPTAELDKEIESIESNNAKVAQYEKYKTIKAEYDDRVKKQDDVQAQMDAIDAEKVDMVTRAKLPVPGLSFDEDIGLLIDGIPFDQKSSAEQLRISTQLAMAFDPELRVIYVKDGSLLDEKTLAIFQEMAKEKDYMVLVEIVGETDRDGAIVMRAGNASVRGS